MKNLFTLVLFFAALTGHAAVWYWGGHLKNNSPDTRTVRIQWSVPSMEAVSGSHIQDILPGETWMWLQPVDFPGEFDAPVYEFSIDEYYTPNTEVGYSLVASAESGYSSPDFVSGGGSFPTSGSYWHDTEPADVLGAVGFVYEWGPESRVVAPTPGSKRTLWKVESAEGVLTAEVFREGIDKVVYAQNEAVTAGGSGGVPPVPASLEAATTAAADYLALIEPLTDQVKAFTDAQTVAMNDAYLAAVGEIQQPTSPYPGDESAAFHIGPDIEFPALGATISTDVFEHLPFIGTFFTILRELILIWMAFYFIRYCGNHLREWYKLAFMTPQLTTKSAGIAGDQLQVVGIAKQFSLAAVFMVAFIAVVAATIAGYNSRLGDIADGVNVANLMTQMQGGFGPSLANSTVSTVASFVGLFFPWQAAFAFLVARYAIEWFTIPLWSAALFAARLIHF